MNIMALPQDMTWYHHRLKNNRVNQVIYEQQCHYNLYVP
uniref:Uncharacterized protein n=1 Tax=Rhizophora mucronata TaxID=61149 RepID=A0A2P2QY95_RHIMU